MFSAQTRKIESRWEPMMIWLLLPNSFYGVTMYKVKVMNWSIPMKLILKSYQPPFILKPVSSVFAGGFVVCSLGLWHSNPAAQCHISRSPLPFCATLRRGRTPASLPRLPKSSHHVVVSEQAPTGTTAGWLIRVGTVLGVSTRPRALFCNQRPFHPRSFFWLWGTQMPLTPTVIQWVDMITVAGYCHSREKLS